MFINSDLYLFLRYWLTNKVNIKRPSTGLLMYTMATRFCDEIHLYGFWPFPKDGSGNPVKYHYYDMLKYRYFSNASPHRMPLEFKTLKMLHSKGALKLTTSKCKPAWPVQLLNVTFGRKDRWCSWVTENPTRILWSWTERAFSWIFHRHYLQNQKCFNVLYHISVIQYSNSLANCKRALELQIPCNSLTGELSLIGCFIREYCMVVLSDFIWNE